MNICVLASSYPAHPRDVAGTFVPHLVRALRARGHRVLVVTQAKPGPRDKADPDVRWFPWLGGGRALVSLRPWYPWDALALVSWLRGAASTVAALRGSDSPAVCLALMALPAGLVAWGLQRLRGIPYVVWCLGSDIAVLGRQRLAQPVLRAVLSDAATCFADGVRLAEQAAALAARPCAFLPTTRPLPPAAPASLPAQQRHVLFIGRLERIKGPDVLLDAWTYLRRYRRDAVLHVVGDGSLGPALRARAERRGIAEAVIWEGTASAQRIAGLLAAADAVAIPSRSESVPLVLSEALQMGVPLAVTDVGDMGQLVRQYGLGAVAPTEDPAALAVALGRILAAGRAAFQPRLAAAYQTFALCAVTTRLEEALVQAACGRRAIASVPRPTADEARPWSG